MVLSKVIQSISGKESICSHGKITTKVGFDPVARYSFEEHKRSRFSKQFFAYYTRDAHPEQKEVHSYTHRSFLVCKSPERDHSHHYSVTQQKFEKEIQAFLRMEHELIHEERYANKYIAIHNELIVDFDSDRIALTDRVYAKYGYIPILMRKVETERTTRFYSSRRPR